LLCHGVAVKLKCCNEKGIRFESVTVPAAVMPGRVNDHGLKYLPLSAARKWVKMGRLLKPGQVRRPARQNHAFKAFGKKSAASSDDSPNFSSGRLECW
jgi:hypothetical protein